MRTFVRSSNTGEMTCLKATRALLRTFVLFVYRVFAPCERTLDQKRAQLIGFSFKSCFSIIFSCPDNRFHLPTLTAHICIGCVDQVCARHFPLVVKCVREERYVLLFQAVAQVNPTAQNTLLLLTAFRSFLAFSCIRSCSLCVKPLVDCLQRLFCFRSFVVLGFISVCFFRSFTVLWLLKCAYSPHFRSFTVLWLLKCAYSPHFRSFTVLWLLKCAYSPHFRSFTVLWLLKCVCSPPFRSFTVLWLLKCAYSPHFRSS
jgi:hypothetical protein